MKLFLLPLALACCTPALADVRYDFVWDDTTTPRGVRGELVVTDQAWRSGSILWNSNDHVDDYASSPVIDAWVFVDGPIIPEGGGWSREGDNPHFGWFDLRFVGDGIEGSMYIESEGIGISTGEGTVNGWTFVMLNTDDDFSNSPCEEIEGCTGTGRWVLDQSTVPVVSQVPLPATLALIGLGLVGVTRRTAQQLAALR